MRSVLRTTATIIALGTISFLAYAHYHHRHPVTSRGSKPVRSVGLGPIEFRAVIIKPKEIGRPVSAGNHVAVLVARRVFFPDMYVLAASTDGKTVTLRATQTQAAALIRLTRTAHHRLVVQRRPPEPRRG